MRLAQWQEAFLDVLSNDMPDTAMDNWVMPHDQCRLGVYKNNVNQALINTLLKTYPLCLQIVGEQCFSQMASHYVLEHSMQSNNLNDYGAEFNHFLQQQLETQPTLQSFEYLVDLASMEWLLQCCYYAANSNTLDSDAIAMLSNEKRGKIVFELRPDIHYMQSPFPLYELWLRHQNQDQTIEIASPAEHYYVCIYRRESRATVERMSKEAYDLLVCMADNQTLQSMVENECHTPHLAQFVRNGWISSFYLAA